MEWQRGEEHESMCNVHDAATGERIFCIKDGMAICDFKDHQLTRNLVVAAPKLLAALELAAYWLYERDSGSIQFHDSQRKSRESIYAAIAEATGKD